MPSDPTPNEAEMREAEEWYRAEWPRRNKDADNWRTVDVIISAEEHRDDCCAAYAAALAKCRVERETCVGHCQHCKTTIQNKDGCVVDSRGMFHPICATTLAAWERCAKVAEVQVVNMEGFAIADRHNFARHNMEKLRAQIAAAIRGGAE